MAAPIKNKRLKFRSFAHSIILNKINFKIFLSTLAAKVKSKNWTIENRNPWVLLFLLMINWVFKLDEWFQINEFLVAVIASRRIVWGITIAFKIWFWEELHVWVHSRHSYCCLHQVDVQVQLWKCNVQIFSDVSNLDVWFVLSHDLLWVWKVVYILQQDINFIRVSISSWDQLFNELVDKVELNSQHYALFNFTLCASLHEYFLSLIPVLLSLFQEYICLFNE